MTELKNGLLNFKEIELSDIDTLTNIFENSGHMGSDASFATM